MDNVVFSQIDFGLFMPLLENDDITDISYSILSNISFGGSCPYLFLIPSSHSFLK